MKIEHTAVAIWLSSLADGRRSKDACEVSFDFVQLQDATQTFADDIAAMSGTIVPFVENLLTTYPGSRYGLSTFADKPIPFSGFGSYASYYPWYQADTCYNRILPLSTSAKAAGAAMKSVYCSGGGDYFENHVGAMIDVVVDQRVGWEELRATKLKAVLMMTDSLPHAPGDAAYNIKRWNDDWCLSTMDTFNLQWGDCNPDSPAFADCQRLGPTYRENPSSLSPEDAATMELVVSLCGPYPFENPATAAGMGTDDCIKNDYQSLDQLCDAFLAERAVPIIFTSGAGDELYYLHQQGVCYEGMPEADCLAKWWSEVFAACGVYGIFEPLTNIDELEEMIMKSLEAIALIFCEGGLDSTTTTLPPRSVLGVTETTVSTGIPVVTELTTPVVPELTTPVVPELTTPVVPELTTPVVPDVTTPAVPTTIDSEDTTGMVDVTTTTTTALPTTTGKCFGGGGKACLCPGEIVMQVKDLELLMARLIRAEIVNGTKTK